MAVRRAIASTADDAMFVAARPNLEFKVVSGPDQEGEAVCLSQNRPPLTSASTGIGQATPVRSFQGDGRRRTDPASAAATAEGENDVRADTNKNGPMDEGVDVMYATADSEPCNRYMIDRRKSMDCGSLESASLFF